MGLTHRFREQGSFLQKPSSEGFIPLLTYARSAQLHEMSRLQISRHPQPHRLRQVFEATVSEALKPMVASGQGVACMPHSMVALQIERGELIRLYPEMEADHLEIILVRWRDNRNPAAQALWTRLVEEQRG